MDKKNKYFHLQPIAKGIWAIHGSAHDLMYLVVGRCKAMLVDTGMGIGDLAAEVRNLTDLPLVVVNTHGHPDHAGGNYNFDEAWLSLKDEALMRAMCTDEYRLGDVKAMASDQNFDVPFLEAGLVHSRPYRIHPIQDGQIFDLGDRKFEVLEVPGHTAGSICLLDAAEKIIFTGDTIVPTPVWVYLGYSSTVAAFLQSLKKLETRKNDFQMLLPGHPPTPLDNRSLEDLIDCAEEILNGTGIGKPTRTFAGEGLLWAHGLGQIIYDSNKLR